MKPLRQKPATDTGLLQLMEALFYYHLLHEAGTFWLQKRKSIYQEFKHTFLC